MIYIDFETYNTHDIRLVGTYKYVETCQILLMAYAFDDEPVQLWDATTDEPFPVNLTDRLYGDEPITAHNANFDRLVLEYAHCLPTAISRWRCTMAKAYSLSLPGALGNLGAALGLPEAMLKMTDGKKLIQRFCTPAPSNHKADRYDRHSHPEAWDIFKEYAMQDVDAMRHIDSLLPEWNYSGSELALWHLDQKINDRGFRVDVELAEAAIKAADKAQEQLAAEIDMLTGGKVTRATQRDKLLQHLMDEYDFAMDGLTKADVEAALNSDSVLDPVKRILVVRQKASKTSVSKYEKVLKTVSTDGRLKGTLQFDGAGRTRRWGGRMFQPQNIARPKVSNDEVNAAIAAFKGNYADMIYDNVMAMASNCLRGLIVAGPGKKLVVSDLSAIEGRVIAWLAGEKWKLEAYGRGEDLYVLAYAKAFHLSPTSVTGDQRQIGKVMELALGFQGSKGAFIMMASGYGLELPEKQIFPLVQAWRQSNPNIVKLWYKVEEAAIAAVRTPDTSFKAGRLIFRCIKNWLLMKLPSGQVICYFRPSLDEEGKLRYWGQNQTTRKWEEMHTYGGKLVENATQSVARDILANAMPHAERYGYKIVLTVHDELVCETPDKGSWSVKELSEVLSAPPPWAEGLPLAAAGFEALRYRKD